MKNQKKAYIFAIISVLFWSTVATSFKFALNEINPSQTLFFSIINSLAVLFLILVFQKKIHLIFKSSTKELLFSAFLGFLNPFTYYLVLFKAYSLLPAQLAQPLNYTWPIILVILSAIILKQKLNFLNFIAIIISFIGVVFISLRDKYSFEIENPEGILLATGSSIFWALFWILNVKDKRDDVIKLFLNFFFGLIFISIFILLTDSFIIPTTKAYLSTLYIGIFETGVTFVLWLYAMKFTERTDKIGNLVYISPFLSLFFINLVLKESIYFSTIIGLILIVTSIIFQQFVNKYNTRKKIESR